MKDVAIIGGGLAGSACAYALGLEGITPTIYEAGEALASEASGNSIGLYNPRFTAERSPESEFYVSAFSLALRTFPTLGMVDWNPCGALHLINDEKKERRFHKTAKNWGWPAADMRIVPADEASTIAGIDLAYDALYLSQSGYISPRKLCAAYAKNSDVQLKSPIENLEDIQESKIILACGIYLKNYAESGFLDVRPVRGQVTYARSTDVSRLIKTSICYGGYTTPAIDGVHLIGSTFQRWMDHSDILPEDDADNIGKFAAVAPEAAEGLSVCDHRASVRTTSVDHFPIVGALPHAPHIYVSAAHGSHGILSSLMAAHMIADMIVGRPAGLPRATMQKLQPERFLSS